MLSACTSKFRRTEPKPTNPTTVTTGSNVSTTTQNNPTTTQKPATQAPATITQKPATQAPTTTTAKPATQAPVTQAQVTTTNAPATQAPVTQAPATQAPVTQAPATQAPGTTAPVVTTTQPIQTTPITTTKAPSEFNLEADPTGNGYYPSLEQVKIGSELFDVDKKTISQYLANASKYANVLVQLEGYAVSIDTTNALGIFNLMDAEGNNVYVYGCSIFGSEFSYTDNQNGSYKASLTHKTGSSTLYDGGAGNFIKNNTTLVSEGQFIRVIGTYGIYNGVIELHAEVVGVSSKNVSSLGAIYTPTTSGDNVTVSLDKAKYSINENCTATLTPTSGYQVTGATLTRINNSSETLTVTDNKVTFKVGYGDKLVITTADNSLTSGTKLAAFEFGADDTSKSHTDGSSASSYTETSGTYTLTLSGMSKVYKNAYDDKGNGCLKLGTGSATAEFSFTVGSDVDYIIIYVAGYKASNGGITINGVDYTITDHSNDGKYTAITIDTRTVKTISFATTSPARAMLSAIEFYKA